MSNTLYSPLFDKNYTEKVDEFKNVIKFVDIKKFDSKGNNLLFNYIKGGIVTVELIEVMLNNGLDLYHVNYKYENCLEALSNINCKIDEKFVSIFMFLYEKMELVNLTPESEVIQNIKRRVYHEDLKHFNTIVRKLKIEALMKNENV